MPEKTISNKQQMNEDENRKKPQFKIEKIADIGTENKFVSRITIQMFDFLECSLIEEKESDEIKGTLLGLMDLFLREEKWITEYINEETIFFKESAFKEFPITDIANSKKLLLGKLDQRIKAFFLNLVLAFNECYKIASFILGTEIKDFDSLSKNIESITNNNHPLRRITSNESNLFLTLQYFNDLLFKFTLGPQHINKHSTSGKLQISIKPSDPEIR